MFQKKIFKRSRFSFEKGNPLGVIAPETANNSCVSSEPDSRFLHWAYPAGLRPRFFLAAINIYGLRPGYAFFSEAGPIAWALITGLFFAQFIFFVAGRFPVRIFSPR